jgi:NTP pyrophosphatase (non-canonical NTP hydrolase)
LKKPLELASYAAVARSTDRFAQFAQRIDQLRFGLFGEVGGLLAALKKVNRDDLLETETQVAAEEIGDALWYLFATADALNVRAEDLGAACLRMLRVRLGECDVSTPPPLTFRQIDGLVAIHPQNDTERNALLGELAKTSGELVHRTLISTTEASTSPACEVLANILALMALVSSLFRLPLEQIAEANLVKIKGRWPGKDQQYVALFDDQFPEHEQLPREFSIEFIERGDPETGYVVQRLRGVYIGDRLTDNSHERDDYRFHDVFHLAYAAYLGWSPVIRALLKVKRKSRPEIDEREDGARAMIIEEGIATWIFNHAKPRELYEGIAVGKLDYSLLKQVHSMVGGYEVSKCPLWQWEKAILEGFRVFRELRKLEHRGGTVSVDMINHTLQFDPPPRVTA